MKCSGWPNSDELIVRKVDDIADFSVLADLGECEDKHGLCHINEVTSRWIENVRDHIREGQTVVTKVFEVNESSQQIDLSIEDVNECQRKEKIQEWKNEQEADKWMALTFGEGIADDRYQSVANALLAKSESLYDGPEQAAIHGIETLDGVELDDDEPETIVETTRRDMSVLYVNVTGYVDLCSPTGDDVDDVKEVLETAESDGEIGDEIELLVTYVGAPECHVEVRTPDYKTVETELESSVARAHEAIEAAGGTAEYHRGRSGDEE